MNLREIVDSFTSSAELFNWAEVNNISEEPYVNERILHLIYDEISNEASCNAHLYTMDDQEPPRKRQRTMTQYGGNNPVAEENPKPYIFRQRGIRTFAKTDAVETTYEVVFNDNWIGDNLSDLNMELQAMFDDILTEVSGHLQGNDLGRIVVYHSALANPIVVHLRRLEELNGENIMKEISKVLNSHEKLTLDTSFRIDVGVIQMPKGAASHLKITQLAGDANSIKRKSSFIHIVNDDDLCMPRAIACVWAKENTISNAAWQSLKGNTKQDLIDIVLFHRKCPKTFYKNVSNSNRSEQKKLALALCKLAGVSTDRPCSLMDIPAFERVLGCRILVISARAGNKFIRTGDGDLPRLYLYLVETPNPHFHAITTLTGFFSQSYFCTKCLKPYQNKKQHTCEVTCRVCSSDNCRETNDKVICPNCNMTCRSNSCLARHGNKKKDKKGNETLSNCETYWRCPVCYKCLTRSKRKPEEHVCEEWHCPCCQQYVPNDHLCYQPMKTITDKPTKLIFYDFECRQDHYQECENGFEACGTCDQCPADQECSHKSKCRNCNETICGKQLHTPNFLVAQTACDLCQHLPVDEASECVGCGTRCNHCSKRDPKTKQFVHPPCKGTCGLRQVIFDEDETHRPFCQWLFSEAHRGFTAIAHNNKGYDAYFLLEYMIDQSMRPDKIIYSGSKIMYCHVERGLDIRIIDSLNFLPMKLADLPKAFGFTELKKGYFPHNLNTKENQNYKSNILPDPDMYGVKYMGSKDRQTFLEWHALHIHDGFDFKKDIRDYCVSDVTVLREACLKFRTIMLENTGIEVKGSDGNVTYNNGVEPFTGFITIASVCMGIFQSKFLHPHRHVKLEKNGVVDNTWHTVKTNEDGTESICLTNGTWKDPETLALEGCSVVDDETVPSPIGQTPSEGYVKREQYSKVSIQWLSWLQSKHPRKYSIQHALKGGEFHVPCTNYRADGYCPKSKTIFEFQGCLWHGCPDCYPHDRSTTIHPRTKQSVQELYALTCKKKQHLSFLGYTVVEIWEHSFMEQLKSNSVMKTFVDSLDLQDRLEPRHSFFGGRTNACKLHYEVGPGEEIHYSDFTSLYPWVNKYARYPVGHPTIITQNFDQSLTSYFGIAKVKVLPPRGLYHPVLPYRSGGKLKFPLCRLCADTEQQTPCNHTVEERSILGTWCTPEIMKALDKGYTILKIYEIYHWSETSQYDPEAKEGGLFTEYINTFLRLKQQASGWPHDCNTDTEKTEYIDCYKAHEGIELDRNKIVKNPGLRSLAKLCLNSFWGKFGQNLNQKQSVFIHENDSETFFQLLTDPSKIVTNFHIIANDIIQLEYQHEINFTPEDVKTNIFLATFTTSWARLKLYDVLEKLDRNCLYFDTDSVVYVTRKGQWRPSLGVFLGDLTNELDENDYITCFISGGPKNYAYRTNCEKETCKVRGFTLNYNNSQKINFAKMREMVLSPSRDGHVDIINPSKISRDKRKRKIFNKPEKKKYQIVYTKRVIQPNMDTLPYGY